MALLITAAFTSVLLVTVVEGQGESAACLSALQSLASNVGCFTSFVNIGNAIDMGTRVPDADISTVCATFCKMLILEISTECDTVSFYSYRHYTMIGVATGPAVSSRPISS